MPSVHICFSKNLGTISMLKATEGGNNAISVVMNNNYGMTFEPQCFLALLVRVF